MKIAIVTGASSGMGKEFVKQIAQSYPSLDQIWVIARRRGRLEHLQKELTTEIVPVPLDLRDRNAMIIFKSMLEDEKPDIKILVNAAGFGKVGPFDSGDLKDQLDMISLNCKALTEMTYLCLPYMQAKSRIIQMASAAAFTPQQDFAVYSATKAYVLSFTRGVNKELQRRGIWMTAVCPGPVETEFFEVAEKTGYHYEIKNYFRADPEAVVHKALADCAKQREMSVYGASTKLFHGAAKLIPHRVLLSAMEQIF